MYKVVHGVFNAVYTVCEVVCAVHKVLGGVDQIKNSF